MVLSHHERYSYQKEATLHKNKDTQETALMETEEKILQEPVNIRGSQELGKERKVSKGEWIYRPFETGACRTVRVAVPTG